MDKLLFNPKTNSIVFYLGTKYYDMRNGKELGALKLPLLQPFNVCNKSSKITMKSKYSKIIISNIVINIEQVNNTECQFSGYLPRYFFKGFIKLINDGILCI